MIYKNILYIELDVDIKFYATNLLYRPFCEYILRNNYKKYDIVVVVAFRPSLYSKLKYITIRYV